MKLKIEKILIVVISILLAFSSLIVDETNNNYKYIQLSIYTIMIIYTSIRTVCENAFFTVEDSAGKRKKPPMACKP